MYEWISRALSDRKGGVIFTCFGVWHFAYILLTFAVIAAVFLYVRKKGPAAGRKAAEVFIDIAFALYVADFFLMPFAYGEIDIEKLPFHACTAMCAACFISRRWPRLFGFRTHFALLGFLSNLVYLIYPAGVMWHAVHPLCYRVIQTLLFHGIMTAHGFFALLYDEPGLERGKRRRDLIVLAGMALWALLGNTLYNGMWADGYREYNWFFVVGDPFGILDPKFAPYIMPFVNILLFFAVETPIVLAVGALSPRLKGKSAGAGENSSSN